MEEGVQEVNEADVRWLYLLVNVGINTKSSEFCFWSIISSIALCNGFYHIIRRYILYCFIYFFIVLDRWHCGAKALYIVEQSTIHCKIKQHDTFTAKIFASILLFARHEPRRHRTRFCVACVQSHTRRKPLNDYYSSFLFQKKKSLPLQTEHIFSRRYSKPKPFPHQTWISHRWPSASPWRRHSPARVHLPQLALLRSSKSAQMPTSPSFPW